MGKPRLIILIRHAQSEGNKNRDIHQTVPDHRVKLTPEGQKQAIEAGRKLRSLLRPDDTLHFYTSPYRRTRETTEGILSSLTSDDPEPSPFPRHTITVYEEPRLREQDFGNFQPCSAEMTRMWQERADYGHFFYRIPNGESAADAYDRISGFNESLWRSFGEEDFASVCVLVTHGLMTRVFLMKWYHWSVEYFEDLRNMNHCEFVVMGKNQETGKYILKNQLRTWTQFKRDRAAEQSLTIASPSTATIPTRKRWGGCPDGCSHTEVSVRPPRRQNTADLFRDEGMATQFKKLEEALEKENADRGRIEHNVNSPSRLFADEPPNIPAKSPLKQSHRILSPNRLAVLSAGRDGGGSRSGDASRSGSEDDEEADHDHVHDHSHENGVTSPTDILKENLHPEDTAEAAEERRKQFRPPRSMSLALTGQLNGTLDGDGLLRTGTKADALGDQSDMDDSDLEEHDMEGRLIRELELSVEESVR